MQRPITAFTLRMPKREKRTSFKRGEITNVYDPRSFCGYFKLSSSEKGLFSYQAKN